MKNRWEKAQSLSEYAIVLSLVLGAILAMQVYVTRGLQGRYKDASDSVIASIQKNAPNLVPADKFLKQYEPYYVESVSDINTTSDKISSYKNLKSEKNDGEHSTRTGTQATTSNLTEYEKY